jgi:hypothetical protein
LKVTFVSIENTIYDPLTNKLMDSLINNSSDFEVVAIGVNRKEQKGVSQSKNDSLHEIISLRSMNLSKRLNFIRLPILYLEYCYKVISKLMKVHPDLIYTLNFSTLLPVAIYKFFSKNTTLIYHARELESQQDFSRFMKSFVISVEKISLLLVDFIVTPSDSITEWYKKTFKTMRVTTLYNCPVVDNEHNILDDYFSLKYGFKNTELIFVHSGAITDGRNIELMVKVFTENDLGQLVFIGPITSGKYEFIKNSKISNVHYHETVGSRQLVNYLKIADVGISIIDSSTLSYELTIPNKFFEYVNASIPIIFNFHSEIEQLNDKFNLGFAIEPDYYSLLKATETIKELLDAKPNYVVPYELTWDYQKVKFINLLSKYGRE